MTDNKGNDIGSKLKLYLVIGLIAMTLFTCASRHRVGCHCWDGSESSATGSGACSHHGGVMYWEHEYWWDK
jgi:hypothetical protein